MATMISELPSSRDFYRSYPSGPSTQTTQHSGSPFRATPHDFAPDGHKLGASSALRQRQAGRPSPQYVRSLGNKAAPPSVSTSTPSFSSHWPHPISSEHMLRRKTPSGTLAAGYDGSPTEWPARAHAAKYLLLPDANSTLSSSQRMVPTLGVPSPRTDSTYGSNSNQDVQQIQPFQKHTAIDASFRNSGPIASLQSDMLWGPKGAPAAGFDSVLNQTSLYNQQYRLADGNKVSKALQPVWPPYIDPTFGQQPAFSGPHWPGTVVAPQRDNPPGYRSQLPYCNELSEFGPSAVPRVERSASNADGHLRSHEDYRDIQSIQFDERNLATPRSPGAVCGTGYQHHEAAIDRAEHGFHHGTALAYRSKEIEAEHDPHQTRFRYGTASFPNSDPAWNLPHLYQQVGEGAGHAQFKEKILAWAHRIYGALLASVEQERRNPSREQHPHQNPSRICPPHPRRPYPSWSNGHHRAQVTHHLSSEAFRSPLEGSGKPSLSPAMSRVSTGRSGNPIVGRVERPPLVHGFATTHPGRSWHSMHLRPYANPAQASYVPAQFTHDQDPSTPAAAATHALEVLGRLCEESRWLWIEGILLSGCLAYGLGNYEQALALFSQVLQQECANVEGISNLAVTLMAMDKRQEAEQYWVQAVRLNPAYFDAVEGLIGLLHECQRGREAVKVVEHIEDLLRDSRVWKARRLDHSLSALESRVSSETFSLSGYQIPASDNGRLLALIHGKGNVLYQIGDNVGAAKAFEDAILVGAGRACQGIQGLIRDVVNAFNESSRKPASSIPVSCGAGEPLLLAPDLALETSRLVFPPLGHLPGLAAVSNGASHKAAVSIVSNSLLSLAKIYQDGMSSSGASATAPRATSGVQEILALYYLSLSLQPSPSTANNVGILLAGVQQSARSKANTNLDVTHGASVPGVIPGSGVALALAYYDYGLQLDPRHAHLYTNLGSLFKDIGQLNAAIRMYEKAVDCDGTFDIALANLANAVKDKGDIGQAITYYKRAVHANPEFAEAVCGLANALNSVCRWSGRGGISPSSGIKDRWHVDENGVLYDSRAAGMSKSGWIERVVAIVGKQLLEGQTWGQRILHTIGIDQLLRQMDQALKHKMDHSQASPLLANALNEWAGAPWEGAKVVRLVERATKRLVWQIYRDKYVDRRQRVTTVHKRPQLPAALAVPGAPTVLPFHTFTCPLSASQIRKISQRNGLRVSCSTLRAPWLPSHVFEPPQPPQDWLNVGYVSSDFNNHPLAHLMQSVFGLHNPNKVKAICYATTASDSSTHRRKIEREAPVFYDASSWSIERLVNQIVSDGIHILVNLNGYTRGAKNEVFAARPAPIQMSFMGFAGTLGAEWCDYLLADKVAVPPQTLRRYRNNVDLVDQTQDGNFDDGTQDDWVYGENIIFARDTFFCCDHRQSAPDADEARLSWAEEGRRRWRMRKELFPDLADDAVILGNFNQLYKIEPTTFRLWLRILSRVPKAVLWLLRFPDLGEQNLRQTALLWGGDEVASRILFTDVAPKNQHISRARICDLFLDTPECNAHTTAADVLWSGTPLLTFPRYEYKMCSRMAASILRGALPKTSEGDRAAKELIVSSDEMYEEQGVELASGLVYEVEEYLQGTGHGRLLELRRLLYESRWTSALFDTPRWVRDLETAYEEAWRRWVAGEGGDILL